MSCSSPILALLAVVLPSAVGVAILDRLIGAWWSARVQRQKDRHRQERIPGVGVAGQPAPGGESRADDGAGDAK